MSDARSPSLAKAAFVCPHCKAHAQQQWSKLGTRNIPPDNVAHYELESVRDYLAKLPVPVSNDDAKDRRFVAELIRAIECGTPGLSSQDTEWMYPLLNTYLSQCFACNGETLWLNGRIIFPSRSIDAPPPNDDLPRDIAADYEEAASVLAQSPRAAAALLRLAIQKLCSHLLGRPGDINEMIGELVTKGLNPMIQQALDVVRVVGNESVHPGILDLKDDVGTATRLFALVNLIAEGMITHPKHVQEMYGLLPESKIKGIEARDKKRP